MLNLIFDIMIAVPIVLAVLFVCYGIYQYGVKHGLVKQNYIEEEYEWEDEEK